MDCRAHKGRSLAMTMLVAISPPHCEEDRHCEEEAFFPTKQSSIRILRRGLPRSQRAFARNDDVSDNIASSLRRRSSLRGGGFFSDEAIQYQDLEAWIAALTKGVRSQ